MRKTILIFIFLNVLQHSSYAQLAKKNWLVGGNGSMKLQRETRGENADISVKSFQLRLAPNLGYFFANKFAAGLRLDYTYDKVDNNGINYDATAYGIGPFLRYYFLPIDNRANLLLDVAYAFQGVSSGIGDGDTGHKVNFSGGPVIFFNSSVAVEFLVNYELLKEYTNVQKFHSLGLAIGFQIHLEKDNQ